MENRPEFRKDLVSGDWVLIAPSRRKKDSLLKEAQIKDKKRAELEKNIKKCPFEDPQKSGNPFPLLWYPGPRTTTSKMEDLNEWFVQVIPNKFPLLFKQEECPDFENAYSAVKLPAVGYHEVIITRDHNRPIDKMTLEELQLVLKAYKERYRTLAKDPCVKYILIFHNQGREAGASLFHPHSQLVALPVVDPYVSRRLKGAAEFYKRNKKCVHCVMIEREIKDGLRVVDKNEHFITLVPFAPRVSYETRIYPVKHSSRFEDLDKELFPVLAKSLKGAISRINSVLGNPDYNFFIHTSAVKEKTDYYHWHIEILPRGFSWAGLELGGGVEVIMTPPEEAAGNLRKAK